MMDSMLLPLRRYFEFTGRSSRREFWLFLLFIVVAMFVLGLLDAALGLGGSVDRSVTRWDYGFSAQYGQHGGLLTGLFALAMIIPFFAVSVRRLHDSNHSGWWLLMGLMPLVGVIVLFVFYVQPSQSGENRFGPTPLA
jgi:uncharacterized membrane protein YhaH (DUF805 family)